MQQCRHGVRRDERRAEGEQYANAATRVLYPTDSTEELLAVALRAAESIFRASFRYKKAGVMLNGMKPSDHLTGRMFGQDSWERTRRVSQAIDEINRRFGRHTVRYGSVETEGRWQTKAAHKSQRYTTNLSELLSSMSTPYCVTLTKDTTPRRTRRSSRPARDDIMPRR